MALSFLKRPESFKDFGIEKTQPKITQPEQVRVGVSDVLREVPQATRTVFGTIGDFGKTVGQTIARSFVATGKFITETVKEVGEAPYAPKRHATFADLIKEAAKKTYTPIGETERKIFGTDQPISFETIGEDTLAIGGEDFKQKWGNYAIPVGMLIAGIDVTPIGWGKKGIAKNAATKIAKTSNTFEIAKILKPMFKGTSDDTIKFLARSLKSVNKESDVFRIINQAGNLNIPKAFKGVPRAKPSIKPDADTSLYQLYDMHRTISAPPKMSIEEARAAGVALRVTKGGKVLPSIRKSGVAVPEEFATYQNFKDVKAGIFGGTKDITRAIQEIDGALPLSKRVNLPGQAGPAERFVLWRTRDIMKMRMGWLSTQEAKLKAITKGISDKEAMIANRVLEKISRNAAYVSPEKLAQSPEISKITTNKKIIKLAQDARKYFDSTIKAQNDFRLLRNQPEIPYRAYYSPHEIQKTSLWEKSFGLKKEPNILMKPELPDYIKPDKPFNPRELAREAGLPDFLKEQNLKTLLENYANTSGRDIFNTSIVQNNKAFAQQLEAMGHLNSARLIQDWTAEAFAGVKAVGDRAMAFGPTVTRGMSWWRQGLVKGVFPLNVAWNTFVQTSSGVLTTTRYGVKNTAAGMFDWVTSPASRKWVQENAYSYIIKTGKAGKVTRQDINVGLARATKIQRSKLDNAVDAANYLTEWTEKHLTGIAVMSAKKEGAKKGLKGKALIEFASDGGAKTQSMYNLEDLPGILRSETVKTAAPFQTFSFEVFNTLREFAGKTGIPPATATERIAWILRFLGGTYAVNAIGNATTGRKPWEASSFIPFYSLIFAPIESKLKGEPFTGISTRNLPSPIGIGAEFADGLSRFVKTGNTDKLRRVSIRYLPGLAGIPGGLQASRIVDGIIAISNEGVYDSAGKMLFPISDTKDKIMSIFAGPWATEGGRQYWEDRETDWLDLFERFKGEPEPTKRGPIPQLKRP